MNLNPSSDKDNAAAAIPVWIATSFPQGATKIQYSASIATTSVTLVSAAGTSTQSNHVTGFQLSNSAAAAQTITILDGASTIMWEGSIAPGATVPVSTILIGTAATALNVQNVTGTGAVFVNVQGYLY